MRRKLGGRTVSSRTKLVCSLVALASCAEPRMELDAAAVEPDAGVTADAAQVPKANDPASSACGERPPRALSALCTGCHELGSSRPSPDLLAYTGSAGEFIAKVRTGGNGMPAFSADAIADAALNELYAYLHAQTHTSVSLGDVQPLFEGAPVLPVSFTRGDGVLVTRGAGRVRGRHELEAGYGPFHELYFEDRTFGFVIEDYTARGESKLVVTYLPVALPTDGTNFRCFKIYGDGNVFSNNTTMHSDVALPALDGVKSYASEVAPYARVQNQLVTTNARSNRPLRQGDLFEFEFGVFIDKSAVRDNSRTNYYSDTFRYKVGSGALTPESTDSSGTLGPYADALLGGSTNTVWAYAEPELSFEQFALNMQHEHVQRFVEGRRLFHTDFDTGVHSEPGNPVFSEQMHKRGPLYVASSCVSCHPHNGGGKPLSGALDVNSSMTFKLYDGALGNQLQLGEGSAQSMATDTRVVKLVEQSVSLSRPSFAVSVAHYSARIARRLVGMGLLESIDESTLLAQADPEDCDGDGISGRAQRVKDPEGGAVRVGRFGWRAEKVSIRHQVADALDADLGVGTELLNATAELSNDDLERMVAYVRLLGVPPQRDADDAIVKQGQQLFHELGCASCHLPALSTGNAHPFVELRGQTIRPYSDLLLHDVGAELADESGLENPREWRTAPLWGVGLSETVQGYVALLHDGRAASVLEAVLWHGGEAQAARDRVVALAPEERAALLRFVESL